MRSSLISFYGSTFLYCKFFTCDLWNIPTTSKWLLLVYFWEKESQDSLFALGHLTFFQRSPQPPNPIPQHIIHSGPQYFFFCFQKTVTFYYFSLWLREGHAFGFFLLIFFPSYKRENNAKKCYFSKQLLSCLKIEFYNWNVEASLRVYFSQRCHPSAVSIIKSPVSVSAHCSPWLPPLSPCYFRTAKNIGSDIKNFIINPNPN